MKRYLICSDIHGNIDNFKIALKEAFLDPIDGVLIAGETEIDSDSLYDIAVDSGTINYFYYLSYHFINTHI